MSAEVKKTFLIAQFFFQRFAMALIILFAMGMALVTTLSATGVLPWLQISAQFGATSINNAGQIVQIGATVFAILLAFFVPGIQRIQRLETSHRQFNMDLRDVTRAYAAAHAADRAGTFRLASEFETMRDRLTYMRAHPDLEELEPGILELAAQMSYASRDLAQAYSDEKVERAQTFLRQRQQEVDRLNARLRDAKAVTNELHTWARKVELEESVVESQIAYLREQLSGILPELGHEEVVTGSADPSTPPNVIALPARLSAHAAE